MAKINKNNPESITSSQQLRLIRRRRLALEQLINFAKNVSMQSKIMEDVLLLSRPSQVIPDKTRERLLSLIRTLDNLSEQELQHRLLRVDQLVQQGIHAIIGISVNIEELESNSESILGEIDRIKELILIFKKRTALSLALRLALKERGVVTQRVSIDFSQEYLAEQVVQLKEEEIKCAHSIRNHIQDVIIECDLLLGLEGINTELVGELKQVKVVMQQNLDHIDSGKSVESMPVNFEAINIGELSPSDEEQQFSSKSEPVKSQAKEKEKEKPMGFFKRLLKWLNSPWNVGWGEPVKETV